MMFRERKVQQSSVPLPPCHCNVRGEGLRICMASLTIYKVLFFSCPISLIVLWLIWTFSEDQGHCSSFLPPQEKWFHPQWADIQAMKTKGQSLSVSLNHNPHQVGQTPTQTKHRFLVSHTCPHSKQISLSNSPFQG